MTIRWIAAVVLLSLAPGCRCSRDKAPAPAASGSAAMTPAVKPKRKRSVDLPPLAAPGPRVSLAVSGFGAAEVAVPLGAKDSRPIVIALHGEDGDPAALCDAWRMASSYGFVLCPRGVPRRAADGGPPGFGFDGVPAAEHELRAALHALRARFKDYLSPDAVVLGGFGRGADIAVQISRQEPSYFARLVLVQGGAGGWSSGVATIYARGGGKRVLFACGSERCSKDARAAVVLSERANLAARLVPQELDASPFAAIAGARFNTTAAHLLAQSWRWLVDDDPAWRAP